MIGILTDERISLRGILIPRSAQLYLQQRLMMRLVSTFSDLFDRFERWFDHRFGWFFTNGMKRRSADRERVKA